MNESTSTLHKKWRVTHPGDRTSSIRYCVDHFLRTANEAIAQRGRFLVALSGGSTPKAIFQELAAEPNASQVDWSKVWLFWSDERAVPPSNSESNYGMAMEAGLGRLAIPTSQIFRMEAESEIEYHAKQYEERLLESAPNGVLDLVMLGMGPDAHTASLFPHTEGLHAQGALIVANYIPKLQDWRMTFTYEAIHRARQTVIYVLGESKRGVMEKVWHGPYNPDEMPIQRVGSPETPALWIIDFPPP